MLAEAAIKPRPAASLSRTEVEDEVASSFSPDTAPHHPPLGPHHRGEDRHERHEDF